MFAAWNLYDKAIEYVFARRDLYDTALAQHVISANIGSR